MQRAKKSKTHTAAIALQTIEFHAVKILLAILIVLGLLYVYFLGSAVVHAVVRKEVQQDIAQASSRIAELEVAYLSRKNDVTAELASELGFTHVAHKSYLERSRYLGQANVQ